MNEKNEINLDKFFGSLILAGFYLGKLETSVKIGSSLEGVSFPGPLTLSIPQTNESISFGSFESLLEKRLNVPLQPPVEIQEYVPIELSLGTRTISVNLIDPLLDGRELLFMPVLPKNDILRVKRCEYVNNSLTVTLTMQAGQMDTGFVEFRGEKKPLARNTRFVFPLPQNPSTLPPEERQLVLTVAAETRRYILTPVEGSDELFCPIPASKYKLYTPPVKNEPVKILTKPEITAAGPKPQTTGKPVHQSASAAPDTTDNEAAQLKQKCNELGRERDKLIEKIAQLERKLAEIEKITARRLAENEHEAKEMIQQLEKELHDERANRKRESVSGTDQLAQMEAELDRLKARLQTAEAAGKELENEIREKTRSFENRAAALEKEKIEAVTALEASKNREINLLKGKVAELEHRLAAGFDAIKTENSAWDTETPGGDLPALLHAEITDFETEYSIRLKFGAAALNSETVIEYPQGAEGARRIILYKSEIVLDELKLESIPVKGRPKYIAVQSGGKTEIYALHDHNSGYDNPRALKIGKLYE